MTFPQSSWTLGDIINKIRNITGSPSPDQLTDTQITKYVNDYFSFVMPFELKEQVQLDFYEFKAFPNQDVYPALINFLTDQPMAYADGFPLIFYADPDIFYQDWPIQYGQDAVATGNGITTVFAGNTQAFPVIAGTFFITDGIQVLQDDGTGTLTGNGSGTINNVTGAFNASFTNPPASSLTIYDKYQAYEPARPQGVLWFQNEFTFRPIPDQVYQIQMQGYIVVTQLTSSGDTPIFSEWGQLIAYGASFEIFQDRGDTGSANECYTVLKRYENVALARGVQDYQSQQSVPRF